MKPFQLYLLAIFAVVCGPGSAQTGNGPDGNAPVYQNLDTRHQMAPPTRKVLRPQLKTGRNPRTKTAGKLKNGLRPLNPSGTPLPSKINLVDKNGKPITFWPAGKTKDYTTPYQDPAR